MYPGAKSKKDKLSKLQQSNAQQGHSQPNQPHLGYNPYQNNQQFPQPDSHYIPQPNNAFPQSAASYYPQNNSPFPQPNPNLMSFQNQPSYMQQGPPNYNSNAYNGQPPVFNANQNLYNQPVHNDTSHHQAAPAYVQNIPQNQPHPPHTSNVQFSTCQGKKKAVFIGINYFGQNGELRGCINDVNNIRKFLCDHYGFKSENMWVLTDDQVKQPGNMPTRDNIIKAMNWLVSDIQPNDSYFFHYSGHGGQKKDLDGDEDDGYDETILPVDFKHKGEIIDDEMNAIMVKNLPPGARLTAVFDSCHSGTALDLPYLYDQNGNLKKYNPKKAVVKTATDIGKKFLMGDKIGAIMSLKNGFNILKGSKSDKISKETRSTLADVIMFSGCKDSQTSADACINDSSTGAMSHALIKALSSNPYGFTYIQLLNALRDILRDRFSQVPQLSSGRPMDMNQSFMM